MTPVRSPGHTRGVLSDYRHPSGVPIPGWVEQPSASAERQARVLIADRDREVAELIAHTVGGAGLRSIAAHDEAAARALFESERPSVVILDTNGLDLLQLFRAASRHAAIIVVSAGGHEDVAMNAMALGADAYVVKPFSPRDLLACIRACLMRSHLDSRSAHARAVSRVVHGSPAG
jgi:DNA-binding response OmpR family regulator